ncbi:serine hydrolase [Marinibacterium sp. SX1]|uniref:serine hydrolase n=1 Tax=Marinibacterium sp. SX1 TaxID=3388424 RepID=UPI003D177C6C
MQFSRFTSGLALALALGAGAAQAETPLPALALPDPMPAPPATVLLPVPDERIDAAVAALDAIAQQMMDRSGIPGMSVAVVHEGETIYAKGFGLRAVGQDAPVDADTVFLLASLSKSVGSTVVATQISDTALTWDTPVSELLPWFDMGDGWITEHVTIGDLYAHRSGLPDHAGDDLEDLGYDRRTVLDRLHLLPHHAFRTQYAYTNFGLTAAAEGVANAADTTWAELSESALYQPLGMESTSSRHADYMARDNRAASHMMGDAGYKVADLRQPDAQSPAGGVSSSANDMARWMTMVLAEGLAGETRLIAEDALRPALAAQSINGLPMSPAARGGFYGYGFGVGVRATGRVQISHSGGFALGASTNFTLLPDLDLGIVVLTNAPPTGAAEALAAAFMDQVELGVETRDWLAGYAPIMASLTAPFGRLVGQNPPENPAPAHPNDTYVGQYDNAYFGPARVVAGDDGLVLQLGPEARELAMQHWDGDAFIVRPMTENQPQGSVSLVEFVLEDGSSKASMTIEHLDEEGLGVFLRGE